MDDRTVTLLERAERDALVDMYRAAPPGTDVRAERVGGATVLLAPGLPPFFNRAFAFGVDEPVPEAGVDEGGARPRPPQQPPIPPPPRPPALGVDEPVPEAGVDEVVARLRPVKQHYIQPPPGATEIDERLRGHGLSSSWAWAKVIRGTDPPPDIPTTLDIRELHPAEADRFGAVVTTAFGLPTSMAPWTSAVVGRAGWHAYGAFDHDALVAAGALYVEGDVRWLGLAGALSFHPRPGAQRALMVRRIADALELGCTALATETGILPGRANPSLDNMLRCGFTVAYERPVWEP